MATLADKRKLKRQEKEEERKNIDFLVKRQAERDRDMIKVKKNGFVNNLAYSYKAIWQYDKFQFMMMILSSVFEAAASIVPIVIIKLLLNELTVGQDRERVILYAIAAALSLFIATAVFQNGNNLSVYRFMLIKLRLGFLKGQRLMNCDFVQLDDRRFHMLNWKASEAIFGNHNNTVGIEIVFNDTRSLTTQVLTIAAMGTAILLVSPWFILLLAVTIVCSFLLQLYVDKVNKLIADIRFLFAPICTYIFHQGGSFETAKDIRFYNMTNYLMDKYEFNHGKILVNDKRTFRNTRQREHFDTVMALVQDSLTYGWLCYAVLYRDMNIATFAMLVLALSTFSRNLSSLLKYSASVLMQTRYIDDFRGFLDYAEGHNEGISVPTAFPQGMRFTFNDVSFRYPGADADVIKNISFTIEPEEKLAIVGHNGAGKSTFIKLLTRLYEPTSGEILLNGVNVASYDKNEYYKLIAPVFQEIAPFAFTIAENVTMKEAPSDMTRVNECLQSAGLWDRVNGLPKKANQCLSNDWEADGTNMSGGEQQKLALARALYKDAPCVVLDEPTSALDALAEEKLYQEFGSMVQGKTSIYISHRLSSTRFCSRIALFEEGTIVECGSHDELVAQGGKYAEMFRMQAQYYKMEGEHV
ncbi:ABC transporter ATP-binding protein [Paenibacillus rhizovicinus]|uniref:ABC transporter ATP-binding protein n=1 Tax=Paenibacillus rhizovicinus TaxID=2704463 RepID=A0A6C0P012_9BACL|nr:ABC transporter ATP-binding protein [Paenibacillus rhizovicinus]QHW31860.1 ABC transporter ATP-binding protein [Paenibacillus rhizovicinus]